VAAAGGQFEHARRRLGRREARLVRLVERVLDS
jgi:hypothetical protein